jgi:hypothetical protein
MLVTLNVPCVHRHTMKNVKGAMKYELADRLLTQAAEMGVSSIKWNWRGGGNST